MSAAHAVPHDAPDPAPGRGLKRKPQSVTLQVSGGRPLRLRGELLAEGNSWAPGTEAWHEIALYRHDQEEVAVALRTFRKAEGSTDIHRAELFPNLEEAMAWLIAFDPTADLQVDLDCADRTLSTAMITLRAATLRQRADDITRQYQSLLGEMLLHLDQGA